MLPIFRITEDWTTITEDWTTQKTGQQESQKTGQQSRITEDWTTIIT